MTSPFAANSTGAPHYSGAGIAQICCIGPESRPCTRTRRSEPPRPRSTAVTPREPEPHPTDNGLVPLLDNSRRVANTMLLLGSLVLRATPDVGSRHDGWLG